MLLFVSVALAVDVHPSASVASGMQTSLIEDALVSPYTSAQGHLDLIDTSGDATWRADLDVSATPRWFDGGLESREQGELWLEGQVRRDGWSHRGQAWGHVDDHQRFGLVDAPELLGELDAGAWGESARTFGAVLVGGEAGARLARAWEPTLGSPIASLGLVRAGGTVAWTPYSDVRVGVRGHGAWGWREAAPWYELVDDEHVRYDRLQAGMSGHVTPAWEIRGWTGQDRSLNDHVMSWEFGSRLDFGDVWFDHGVRHGIEPNPLVEEIYVGWESHRQVHAQADFGGFLDLASGFTVLDTHSATGIQLHVGGAMGYGQDRWRTSVEGSLHQQSENSFFSDQELNEFSRSWVGVRLDVGDVVTPAPTAVRPWRSL